MNILLVDDDPEIRLVAGIVLRADGHYVTEVASAEQALREFTGGTFEVVLMDVMLGDDDGIETAQRLIARDSAVRVIFLTGSTRDAQIDRMAAVDPAGIVHKPFDPLTLADTVRRITQAGAP